MKKVLSIVLMLVFLFSAVPMGMFHITVNAEVYSNEEYTYKITDGEATIIDCDTSISGEITLPSEFNGYPITEIGVDAFFGCTEITRITIPDGVTRIGQMAFYGCTKLEKITIPDSVTHIMWNVFENCTKLSDVSFSNNLTYVGVGAFKNCKSLVEIKLPKSLDSLDTGAFENCTALNSVEFLSTVTAIGYGAFRNCVSLEKIILPNELTKIDTQTFYGCSSLKNIVIPESVTVIGGGSFWNCTSLQSIRIPNATTDILMSAFKNCTSLKDISLPKTLATIGDQVFLGCNNFADVWYMGAETEKSKIEIGGSNEAFVLATWHYNSCSAGQAHEITYHERIESSCKDEGTMERWFCSKCNGLFLDADGITSVSKSDLVIPKNNSNHIGGTYIEGQKDSSCVAEGYTGDAKCSGCNEIVVSGSKIELSDHIYGEWIVTREATALKKGFKEKICSVCGHKIVKEVSAVNTANTESSSPDTGDNSDIFLWIALLFISGGAVITLTVVDRKRRMAKKY